MMVALVVLGAIGIVMALGIRQLEAASRNMKELSNQMTQLVAQYQVSSGE